MCSPAAVPIITAGLTAGSVYSNASANRRAANRANEQQALQIRQQIAEQGRQAAADFQRQNLLFQGQQEAATRAEHLEGLQEQGFEQVLEPLEQLQNFEGRLEENTANQRQVFSNDLEASVNNGNQNIGSGVNGRVSEVFSDAIDSAEGETLQRANTRADRRAAIAGASQLFQDDVGAVNRAGQQVGITNAALQRQREIEQFLQNVARSRADLAGRVAPEPVILR